MTRTALFVIHCWAVSGSVGRGIVGIVAVVVVFVEVAAVVVLDRDVLDDRHDAGGRVDMDRKGGRIAAADAVVVAS